MIIFLVLCLVVVEAQDLLVLTAMMIFLVLCLVVVGAQDLLVLSDVEFMSMVANYLRAIFDPKVNMASLASEAMEETVKEGQELSEASSLESTTLNLPDENVPDEKTVSKRPSLWIKCQVSVTNFRVAVIEDVYTENPQALTLRASV